MDFSLFHKGFINDITILLLWGAFYEMHIKLSSNDSDHFEFLLTKGKNFHEFPNSFNRFI